MANSSFDPYELKMLRILQAEGRKPVSELADAIGLSTTPCGRRFDALQKTGVIRGFHARISRRAVGLNIEVFIQVSLTTHSGGVPERFKSEIAERDAVTACWALTGDQDFLLNVMVPDVDSLNHFVMQDLMKIDGVRDVKTNLVLENIKAPGSVPLVHLSASG